MKVVKATAMVLLISLVACGNTERRMPSVASMLGFITGQDGRACVRTNDIINRELLAYNVLSVQAKQKHYLATVMPGCVGLTKSNIIVFKGSRNAVCGGDVSRVGSRQTCVISQIFEFNNREEALYVFDVVTAKREELNNAPRRDE